MSQEYSPSEYGRGGSYVQESSPVRGQNRASIDHAFASDNSISSYDESMLNAELMSRSVSNDGTLESWQWVNDSPSPPVNSSPELARSMPYSPLHGNLESLGDRGFLDNDFNMLSQPSPSRELGPRHPAWGEQPAEEMDMSLFDCTGAAPASTYGTAYSTAYTITSGTTSSDTSTIRGPLATDQPWSHYTHFRSTPRSGHEMIPTATGFPPSTYDSIMVPQFPSSSQFHQPITYGLQMIDTSPNYIPGYLSPRHRSRSSSNSQIAKLTPPPTTMDVSGSGSGSRIPRQLSHLSTEPSALSQSLIAHAGSDKDIASSPSSSSDYVMVDRANHSASDSTTRRKRARTASNFMPRNGNGHGKFIKLNLPMNQQNGTQNMTGVSKKAIAKGRGGRKKGEHLSPEKANDAREMRHVIACWICALQRDHCTTDSICTRCVKRQERGIIEANHSIGCIREKLYDYMGEFIPDHMNESYGANGLRAFADAHIGRFVHTAIRIEIEPILGLPHITCELYEYEPTDRSHLIQHHHWQNAHTRQYQAFESTSAPITFKTSGPNASEQEVYENYVATLANSPVDMKYFAVNNYYVGQDDPFLQRLLKALVEFRPQGRGKLDFVASVNKLLLTCFIFARGCLIPKHERHKFQQLRFFQEDPRFSFFTLPRMASRQFKHTFLQILIKTLDVVLRRLDRVFRSSQGCKEWIMAFYGVVGLAMVFEYIQASVCSSLHGEFKRNTIAYHEAEAKLNFIVRRIDEKFSFIGKLFRLKYNKSFNPISDEECRDRLDPEGRLLVTQVTDLLAESWEFVCERQRVQPSFGRPETFCGRLVSQFLCSVSPP